ncbi:MAG: hypothetical protein HY289_10615 [Planctomycetes bacterium]|nr:hypothetical protein [Planctomycetota bacterium]
MSDYPWYGLAEDDTLQQGDLLFDCPFDEFETTGEAFETAYDVVVLSHSCDLAHDKLPIVQVCPFWDLEALTKDVEFFRSKRGREELRRGGLPGYHLLNRCALAEKPTDFLVVDFRMQFAVKFVDLKMLARGQKPRLRLLPPYREHLAQALARFYMRVGLPVDIPAF